MLPDDVVCGHCAGPIPTGREVVDGNRKFCCHGCAAAFRIIAAAGLADFYRRRDWRETGIDEDLFELELTADELSPFLIAGENGKLAFVVGNVRCPTCVWLVERILARATGVIDVRGNFASHRFTVRFDPETVSAKEILTRVARLGYRPLPPLPGRDNHGRRRELIRFVTAAFFSTQLMVYSLGLYAGFFQGISPGARRMLQILSGLMATPVVFYCGLPFFAGAARGIKNRAPSMDLLVSLGVMASYLYSLVSLATGGETWFEAAAMIVTLVLLGRLIEDESRRHATSGLDRILSPTPEQVLKIENGRTIKTSAEKLAAGDLILVRAGERLPVDAALADNSAVIDAAVVSGESRTNTITRGDEIAAGCVNLDPTARFAVLRPRGESFLARMATLVEEGIARRAPVQKTADRVAAIFVPLVLAIAILTLIVHLGNGEPRADALMAAVSVLVVACPCALGLATPMAMAVAMGRGAAAGIIFRSAGVIQKSAEIDHIVFDKTGTLTQGKARVVAVVPEEGTSRDEVWEKGAIAAGLSNHPTARAIVSAAEPGIAATTVSGREIPGKGLIAEINGNRVILGSRALLREHDLDITAAEGDKSEVWLGEKGRLLGCFLISDPPRAEAKDTVRELSAMGMKVTILSGDLTPVVKSIAGDLGIRHYHGAMTPEDKSRWIEAKKDGLVTSPRGGGSGDFREKILMAGDGINDSPALAAADVSCAMAGASGLAVDASDLILPDGAIERLPTALKLARRTMKIIRQNLFWAFSYNLIAIPLAATGKLAPVWAAALMALSSILVVGNSARLRRDEKKPANNPEQGRKKLDPQRENA